MAQLPKVTTLRPLLVAHINFPRPLYNFSDLQHVHDRFACSVKDGRLIHWKDFQSRAGYKHHMGRSMAIFEIAEGDDTPARLMNLKEQLERVVGVVRPDVWGKLVKNDDEVVTESGLVATRADALFRVVDHETATKTRLSWDECIPLLVRTQAFRPRLND